MIILDGLRIFFGSVFILFLPGLAWSFVFMARREIDWIERLALSFGLSICLVPLAVFWLNWVFDVRVNLLNTVLVVFGLIFIALILIWGTRRSWWRNIAARLRIRSGFRSGPGPGGDGPPPSA